MGQRGGSRERGSQRARRGAGRDALVVVLAERPMHGCELITELEARSSGRWRPSQVRSTRHSVAWKNRGFSQLRSSMRRRCSRLPPRVAKHVRLSTSTPPTPLRTSGGKPEADMGRCAPCLPRSPARPDNFVAGQRRPCHRRTTHQPRGRRAARRWSAVPSYSDTPGACGKPLGSCGTGQRRKREAREGPTALKGR